jgi:hypothetical protein
MTLSRSGAKRLDSEAILRDLVETLASIEHERWAHWQRYVHQECSRSSDGALTIPPEMARRWEVQINTPYAELSEEEKASDREQVWRYLPTIIEAMQSNES